ncbi:dienelactone hydrolase family-domain-containing protein [Mycena galopus ATCC 62051]|nr:dienelactone hydrolase family-domain-containing protein [Mycena galopus ATCC 62051]
MPPGVTHDGTAEGKIEIIDKVVLFLTDIFGLARVNSKLLADDYARNGFKTITPDLFNGDLVPSNAMDPGVNFDIMQWYNKSHNQAHTRPILDKLIAALKADGVTTFAAVGYCFGGRYVFDLAFENITVASATAHPSHLEVPADLEAKADEIFAGFAPGYKREHFDGCHHGFAIRGDLSDPKVKAGKEGAFKATIQWFIKYV